MDNIITFTSETDNNNNKYVWRKEWVSSCESAWSIINKFQYANIANKSEILNIFGKANFQTIKNIPNLKVLSSLNWNKTKDVLGINILQHTKDCEESIIGILPNNNLYFRKHLSFCPECFKSCFHSIFHQFTLFDLCPFHNIELIDSCPLCGSRIEYQINNYSYNCSCGSFVVGKDLKIENYLYIWNKNNNSVINKKYKFWILVNTIHRDTFNKRIFFTQEFVNYHKENIIDFILNIILYKKHYNHSLFYQFYDNRLKLDYSVYTTSKYINKLESMTYEPPKYNSANRQRRDYEKRFNMLRYMIYISSIKTFKAIARYIRKKYLYKHNKCLKNVKTGSFLYGDKICPLALSYVFWYKEILNASDYHDIDNKANILNFRKNNGITISYKHSSLIELIFNKWRFANKYFKPEKSSGTFWIINKVLGYLLIERYKEWLLHFISIATQTNSGGISLNSVPKTWKNTSDFIIIFPKTYNQQIEFHCWAYPNKGIIEESYSNIVCK